MRLLYMTNIPSHHQFPVASALHDRLGDDFTLVFMEPVMPERAAMGWADCGSGLPWVARAWESAAARTRVMQCVRDYDAVVFGAVDTEIVRSRIDAGKLTFKYSERIWKKWYQRLVNPLINPRAARGIRRHCWSIDRPNCHLLAASAYAAWDFARIGAFHGRAWQWGYFPELSGQSPHPCPTIPRILWAGRMIDWKRVDLIVKAATRLYRQGYRFSVDLVGGGPLRTQIEYLQKQYGLEGVVHFHPFTDPAGVRSYMEAADIYVLPSDYNEGWGAVLNEAMGAGCCAVASIGVGAAPWLVKHGETGLLFNSGSVTSLVRALAAVLDRPQWCDEIKLRAWQYSHEVWSADAAADRLVALCQGLLGEMPMPEYSDGPCSLAPSIKRYPLPVAPTPC